MKRLLFVVFFAVVTFVCSAQENHVVKGAVVASDGRPLGTAILIAMGTEHVFSTNEDGTFEIQVPSHAKTIMASAVGYFPMQAEIDGTYLLFKLKPNPNHPDSNIRAEALNNTKPKEEKKKATPVETKPDKTVRKETVEKVTTPITYSNQCKRVVNGAVFTDNGVKLGSSVLQAVGTDLKFFTNEDGTFLIHIPHHVTKVEATADGYLSEQAEVDGSYMVFRLKPNKKK